MEGLDPDEYVKQNGADVYIARSWTRRRLIFHWLADRARQKFDMRSSDGRMEAFNFCCLRYKRSATSWSARHIRHDGICGWQLCHSKAATDRRRPSIAGRLLKQVPASLPDVRVIC